MNAGSTDADRTPSSPSLPSDLEDGVARPNAPSSLLDSLLVQQPPTADRPPGQGDSDHRESGRRLSAFLTAPTVRASLAAWFGTPSLPERTALIRELNRAVARVDAVVARQVNQILHTSRFQRLEAAWRGLQYLTDQADRVPEANVKIKVLHVTWRELERDFERAVEFDQSQLFRKVYDQEFGSPGGEPYGVLIGDYEVHPRPNVRHPHDDVALLRQISSVAAAAFCPFLCNAHPSMFGLDHFRGMEHTLDHTATLDQLDYLKWRSLRDHEDSRFVGLALPRILMREPYQDDGSRLDRFPFVEDVNGPDTGKYLWGGAAFAMGSILIRAFAQAGWLATIRGVVQDVETGGLVTDLPVHSFATDSADVVPKMSTDLIISSQLEKELSDLGFLPLCACKESPYSAFYSSQSIQKPRTYDRPAATKNARISAMLQYMFCVARFAHYVKVLGREKIGSFAEPKDFERFLQNWIVQYVTSDSEAPPDVKARFPLRDAQIQIRPQPGKPGAYRCVMHLAPHYELDDVVASVRLVAELTPSSTPQ